MSTTTLSQRSPLGLFPDRPIPQFHDRVVGCCNTFRHRPPRTSLADGYDIRTVQELLGHSDVRTTMIYTHLLDRGGRGGRCPADDHIPAEYACLRSIAASTLRIRVARSVLSHNSRWSLVRQP
jgi:hypothetical protein